MLQTVIAFFAGLFGLVSVSQPVPPVVTQVQAKESSAQVRGNKGEKLLVLKTKEEEARTTYSFFIDNNLLYENTLPMAIPFNAWDPTDTYVFLEGPSWLVFRADGQRVADISAVWQEKKIPYEIRTITGWASGTLLIVYTSKPDGSRGPAFWFEVPSTAIIQLSG